MKKSKIIVPALAMLVMSTAATVTGTVAWFSMNKTITASDMRVKAAAEGSVVITGGANNLPTITTKATDVSFSSDATQALHASTHDDDYTTNTAGLKYLNNAEIINLETGIRKGSSVADYSYLPVPASNSGTVYFKDFYVYIAGDGKSFEDQTIRITIDGTQAPDSGVTPVAADGINKALSVDFYGSEITSASTTAISSTTYLGTLNLAKTKNGTDGNSVVSAAGHGVTYLDVDVDNIAQSGEGAYAVTMRVYYDGALLENGGSQAYTTYTGTSGTAQSDLYYYSDDQGTGPLTINVGDELPAGTQAVAEGNAKTYARTTSVNSIKDVNIKATFAVSNQAA